MSPCGDQAFSKRRLQARAEVVPTGWLSDLVTADAAPAEQDSMGTSPKEHVMTIIRRTTKSITTLRPLLGAAVLATRQPDLHQSTRRATQPHPLTFQPPEAAPTNSSGVKPPGRTR